MRTVRLVGIGTPAVNQNVFFCQTNDQRLQLRNAISSRTHLADVLVCRHDVHRLEVEVREQVAQAQPNLTQQQC